MGRTIEAVILLFTLLLKSALLNSQETMEEAEPDPHFEEWKVNAWKRPSQCHVCRLLVTELYESFNKTNKKGVLMTGYELDDLDEKKTIVYDKSEIRLLETLENVCDQMKSYVSRARRKFPYVKGIKSHFREGLDNMIANSAVKLNIEKPPDDVMDDNTKEINRLQFKCVHMLEEYEDDITEWYFKHREYDLLEWLCELRVLKKEDQGCLSESDELVAPEDDATTKIYKVDEENQQKSAAAEESADDVNSEWHGDNMDFSESRLDL